MKKLFAIITLLFVAVPSVMAGDSTRAQREDRRRAQREDRRRAQREADDEFNRKYREQKQNAQHHFESTDEEKAQRQDFNRLIVNRTYTSSCWTAARSLAYSHEQIAATMTQLTQLERKNSGDLDFERMMDRLRRENGELIEKYTRNAKEISGFAKAVKDAVMYWSAFGCPNGFKDDDKKVLQEAGQKAFNERLEEIKLSEIMANLREEYSEQYYDSGRTKYYYPIVSRVEGGYELKYKRRNCLVDRNGEEMTLEFDQDVFVPDENVRQP